MIDRIGNCRIIEEIGSGGMAVIYKAVQESLQRTVAIKALKASVAEDAQFAIRFEREALSASSLQHENIIHIYDFHKTEGAHFIVMEFVEGIDLYDLLERCPILPCDVAAIIAMQVARGLDYAHYRGIIHRDIKPANIMVGKSGCVKLMDFGIARDQAFGDLTESGAGLGTPSYMSPEQVLGDRLDYRSDIFSLGIVLYQMLCGRKPFIEDQQKSVMYKIRLEKHPPLHKLNPRVPCELERIVARALQKRKEGRFKSTQELVLALERFVSRRVEMNYHARLVFFLREKGVITTAEADAQLHPAIAGGYQTPTLPGPLGWTGLRRLASTHVGILGAMGLGVAFVHAAPQSHEPPRFHSASPSPSPPSGFVKVSVEPWTEVFVDGKYADTTPFAHPLAIPEGEHQLVFKNPSFVPSERRVVVKRGVTSVLRVALTKK